MSPPHPATTAYRPCMVLATGHPPESVAQLRRQGWDIYRARTGPEVRRLARMLEPELVALDTDLAGESGWLTCAKLVRERPSAAVVLLGDDGPRERAFADFVGAIALIPRRHDLAPLLHPQRFREVRPAEAA